MLCESYDKCVFLNKEVLILVVMEDALREYDKETKWITVRGLNPCCNGRCFARTREGALNLAKKAS